MLLALRIGEYKGSNLSPYSRRPSVNEKMIA